jgi:hypothetical protein
MIQTAKEFYDAHYSDDTVVMMKDFARLHVEAALEEAGKKAKTKKIYRGTDSSMLVKKVIDKESILNAYPLTNII